jgi:hypothetical protein
MNGNSNGAKMLAYLRGEKDLFEERERVAEMRKQLKGSRLGYWLSNVHMGRVQRFWQIVCLLEENSRMPLTEMSRKLNIPVSTLYDYVKIVDKFFRFTIALRDRERNILLRNTPATFEYSYQATASIDTGKEVPLSAYAQ